MSSRSLLPEEEPVAVIDAGNEAHHREIPIVATLDPELIRRWAQRRGAEPATGEASESGPATVDVRDGDAGIRFNFPAVGRFVEEHGRRGCRVESGRQHGPPRFVTCDWYPDRPSDASGPW